MSLSKKILMCSVVAEVFYKSRYELIIKFLDMGYEVILVAPEEIPMSNKFDGMNVRYYKVNIERTGLNPFNDYSTIKKIRRIISIEKPLITYAFGGAKAAIYSTIAASKENVSKNYCMINGLGSIFRGHSLKNKVIAIVMSTLFKYSLKKSNGILFQNNDDLQEFIDRNLVEKEKTLIVNGSGVNLKKFEYSPVQTEGIFLFVGRLLKDKGIYEYIEAAKKVKEKYPESEFWVVGDYDSNPTSVNDNEMNTWIDSGLIKYFGRQENVYSFYKKASVFILPSYHEGTPRACLEAMSVGRPIVTTDAPGCRETVIDRKTGFIVPVKNIDVLVEKMEYFIINNEEVSLMGENALEYAISKYDVNKVNDSIIEFITK